MSKPLDKRKNLIIFDGSNFYHKAKKLAFMLNTKGIYHEKGVDVQIALDIALGAVKDTYDSVYVVSSDTDLIPAIKTAMKEGKKVVYVGFSNFISRAMKKNCSGTVII